MVNNDDDCRLEELHHSVKDTRKLIHSAEDVVVWHIISKIGHVPLVDTLQLASENVLCHLL